jgi:peptidoglycan glycosyltransferase
LKSSDGKSNNNIYKKQNLDDTETESFDLLHGEDEMTDYTPGIDDIDHFDFDDDDVERYRKLNDKETRPPKNKRKKDLNETKYSVTQKKRTNKEIMRVTYVMMLVFFGMIGYFIYFDAVGSKDVINNVHNSRLAKMAEKVVRGTILSADGQILAESVSDENGDYVRQYPYGCTFSHIVGTSSINKSGIELTADYNLISSDIQPLEQIVNEISGQKNPGNNVITTLDASLQQIAHDALGDRQGAVVAIEPSTGKVLAMISKPDYDPNTLEETYSSIIADSDSKVLLNQATQGLFVPGSIFKIATALAYLRYGDDPDDYEYYCSGSISLSSDDGDSYIKCYGGEVHGTVDLIDSFAESCNASFANIGLSLKPDKLKQVCESLLFNTELPAKFTTSNSQFSLSSSDSDWQIGATSIGQGNTVITPIHAAMLASAIANGGTLMEPYVIDEIQSANGTVLTKNAPESYGSLMTASEASQLTEMMKAVVESGTAYKLSGRSYKAAGKTGTAEVSGRGNNAWFVGFAPADDPQIAICVLVEDAGTASSETVPIAAEIFDAYLNR